VELYEYQKRVAEHVEAGRSVILQAPTGAGKTIAALWPFLNHFGREEANLLPRKCIYSVPMRCLANQFVTNQWC
jgi:CRISPR-associated endonuclease/helicase Cas3